ncbi:hypothetical protein P7K49_023851 [Saguinus oedipus]|uniref:Uncharacterized protein n=1 Tax=Saguinus oedipus TaxID=9490 RepID=A0ABQ9UNP0_SAGOE|nr:hypothetical protein P7K49_023851 [Saguinus oedipus]
MSVSPFSEAPHHPLVLWEPVLAFNQGYRPEEWDLGQDPQEVSYGQSSVRRRSTLVEGMEIFFLEEP